MSIMTNVRLYDLMKTVVKAIKWIRIANAMTQVHLWLIAKFAISRAEYWGNKLDSFDDTEITENDDLMMMFNTVLECDGEHSEETEG